MTEQEIRRVLSRETELSLAAETRVREAYQKIRALAAEKEQGNVRTEEPGKGVERGDYAEDFGRKAEYGGHTEQPGTRVEQGGYRKHSGKNEGTVSEYRVGAAGGRIVRRRLLITPAAAALCLLIAVTAAASVYTVSRSDFIQNMFGAGTRESVRSHTEEMEGNSAGAAVSVTYPAREYVDTDEALVEKLLGDRIAEPGIVRTIGNYTLTLQYAVTDGLGAGLSYKLECPEGIKAMEAIPLNNEAKGISFTENRDFYFWFEDGEGTGISGKLIFDAANSTDHCLYLYETAPLFEEDHDFEEDTWFLRLEQYEKTVAQELEEVRELERLGWNNPVFRLLWEVRSSLTGGGYGNNPVIYEEEIPFGVTSIGHETYEAPGGEGISFRYSPMSLVAELPEGEELAYLSLRYRDGSTYLVYDGGEDAPVDNTNYLCRSDGSRRFYIFFNRLVDWEEVEEVTFNDVTVAP